MIPPTYGAGAHIPGAFHRAGLGSFAVGRSRIGAREEMGEHLSPDPDELTRSDPGDILTGITDAILTGVTTT